MAKETRILVVDDEPKICEFLGILLGREGYKTDSAFNAAEALARIEQNSYDLVLTDLKMPGMDGFELITRLKKIRPDLPVIMITGYATVETAVQALRYGVDDYVTKPFNIDELRKVIARSLQSATVQQQKQELAAQLQAADAELARCRKLVEEQCISVIQMLVAKVEAQGQIHGRPFAARGGIRVRAGEGLRRLAGRDRNSPQGGEPARHRPDRHQRPDHGEALRRSRRRSAGSSATIRRSASRSSSRSNRSARRVR